MNALNTNISGISGSKTIPLDTTNQKHIKKMCPTTGRINMNLKKNTKTLNYNNKYDSKSQKNLFSLINIKDQFYSKAPNVPNQFKRKIYSKIDYYLYDKNSKQNLDKIPQIESYNYGDENNNKKITSQNRKDLYSKFRDSDIFNLRKDKNIINKSGEHSFFSKRIKNNNVIYNANNETLLGWKLRKPLPCFMNYSSSEYSLLNREMKNIGNTKEGIIEEVKKISESFNPTHKQKGLTEFIHLSRVSATNINGKCS